MTHAFTYCELHSEDPARSKAFYTELFNWKSSETPTPDGLYRQFHPSEGLEAGLTKNMLKGSPAWIVYVGVDDVRASTARAKSLGGEILAEVGEVPGVGWFSIVRDPAGAAFGLFQRTIEK
jgi:predicted enzyme related to lactoylglutathione lyase